MRWTPSSLIDREKQVKNFFRGLQNKHPVCQKFLKYFCDWVRMHARVFSHPSFWLIPQIWLASYMHILCTWLANGIFWSSQLSWGKGKLGTPPGFLCHRLFPWEVVHPAGTHQGSWASQLGKLFIKPPKGCIPWCCQGFIFYKKETPNGPLLDLIRD